MPRCRLDVSTLHPLVPTAGTGPRPVPATAANPKAKEGGVPPVVLREKARWTSLNTEILRRGIRTTKVNTNVGIRIQPATATVPKDIAEDEINQDLARQVIRVLECKRMNEESKEIFKLTYVTVESKLVKKHQITQCHRCQLYDQRNCHAAAACVNCAVPHPTAECTKRRDAPAKCALCQPSTSTTRPSYAAAVKKSTAKKTKTKTTKKGKTPSTPSRPKPSPKRSVASTYGLALVEEIADYDASETTSHPEANIVTTLGQLIPLIQKINWSKLLERLDYC
ncbi:hypothetical protein Trydic_g17640 [Trypoxylus dichotomus]